MAASSTGLRFTAFITGLQIIASILLVWALLTQGQVFFATVIVLFYIVALWRHPRVSTVGHPRWGAIFVGIWGILIYAVFWLLGTLAGAPSMGFGPNPPMLIPFFILGAWLYGLGKIVHDSMGSGGTVGYLLIVMILVVTGIPGFFPGLGQVMLGGSWGNAGGLVGEAGFVLESALETELLTPIADTYEYTTNRLLNPSRNRNLAQLVCAGELISGGGVFEVASGSASMSQCVENKLGENETQARSEQVTDPVEVTIDDPRIEPFTDHVRVGVPLTNTIVYDLQGVPIDIPAQDVSVTVRWQYLDEVVATRETTISSIPNGDTRLVEFEGEEGSGGYDFRTFPILMVETDQYLRTRLIDLVEEDSDRTADWFISRFENQELSRGRIVYLIRNTENTDISDFSDRVDCSSPGSEELERLCTHLEETVGLGPVLLQGREYSVEVEVSYDYQAEAAFTESSRWRSGNQLLEIWTEAAWQDMPLSERDSWRQTKCGEIDKYGQTFVKQRTAALTTPVVPVMYTDCGISLFRGIEQGEQHEIEIEVGANVNEESDAVGMLDEEQGFRIEAANTTCATGSDTHDLIEDNTLTTDWFGDVSGVGWTTGDSDIAVVGRNVTVQGQRQSLACRTQMALEINLVDDTTYEIPDIG